jgi:hypothetical protein
MRPASAFVGVVAALSLAGGVAWSQGGAHASPGSGERAFRGATAVPHKNATRRTRAWRADIYATSTGEQVRIEISDSYAADAVSGQTWAEFFAGLVHKDELGRVTVRIAPPVEVSAWCGPQALACYSGGLIVMPGEQSGGVPAEEIARHEYGHHVASSRVNPPWSALQWGPKRWASQAGICSRTAAGTAFPNDSSHYELAPGEAFAEVYRTLNGRRAGIPLTWPIIDDSFLPDAQTLRAAEEDVLDPWVGPTVTTVRGRFVARGKRSWLLPIPTPLDGDLRVELRLPRGRLDRLALVGDGGRVLAAGLWAGASTQRLAYTICGQRRLSIRVTLEGTPGRFEVSVSRP